MKQILLRVPDDVHRRLTARAMRDGRSLNSVATEILDAAVDTDQGDRRERLRARASALGIFRNLPAPVVSDEERNRILETTRGIGPLVDTLLNEDRTRS